MAARGGLVEVFGRGLDTNDFAFERHELPTSFLLLAGSQAWLGGWSSTGGQY